MELSACSLLQPGLLGRPWAGRNRDTVPPKDCMDPQLPGLTSFLQALPKICVFLCDAPAELPFIPLDAPTKNRLASPSEQGEEGSLNAEHAERGKGAHGPKAGLTQTLPICEHLQKSELFIKQAMFSVLQLKQLKTQE